MIEDTGEDLMARMAAGDRDAFALLYRRYRADIYRFAIHLGGSRPQAEDVVHDVFLAAAQHAARYRPERASVLPWLLGIARNYTRRRTSERRMLPLPPEDGAAPALAIESDPLDRITRDRQASALRAALAGLPQRYREVIVLCDLHDLSYLDAAGVIGCAVGTVRSRLHRGRALLAHRLSDPAQTVAARLPATRTVL
jgi:RNA polymerase sigma-70 factor (ECF subfamily)